MTWTLRRSRARTRRAGTGLASDTSDEALGLKVAQVHLGDLRVGAKLLQHTGEVVFGRGGPISDVGDVPG